MTREGFAAMRHFPPDMSRPSAAQTPVNRLSNQALVQLFEKEWGRVREP